MTYKALLGKNGDAVYKKCLDIRIAVFVDEQKFTLEDELDEYVSILRESFALTRTII